MKKEKEILRKLIHMLFGIILIISFSYLKWAIFIRAIFALFLILLLLTFLHLKLKIKMLEFFSKENEKKFPLKGILFFIVGSIIVIYIFNKNIALASITILTFGDSVSNLASFFGLKYRVNPFRRYKSLFGTFCGMIVSFLFCLIFIEPLYALVGSFFGSFSEAIAIRLGESDADDNLIMPLSAATSMYILSKII